MKATKTPELDKMLAVQEKSQIIGKFLEWLDTTTEPITLCFYDPDDDEFYQISQNTEKLLAEFFEIDLNKCEQERQQILADLKSDGR